MSQCGLIKRKHGCCFFHFICWAAPSEEANELQMFSRGPFAPFPNTYKRSLFITLWFTLSARQIWRAGLVMAKIGTHFMSRVNRCFIISKGEGGSAADNLVWQLWGPGDAWLADGDIAPVSGQIRCHQIDGYGLLADCVAGGYRCRVSLACARACVSMWRARRSGVGVKEEEEVSATGALEGIHLSGTCGRIPAQHAGILTFTSELTCWALESSVCARV